MRLLRPRIGSFAILLTIVGNGTSTSAFGQSSTDAGEPPVLQEIVVTATKRPESVRSISGSVSAVTEAQLEEVGARSMADYLTRTPGVVLNASVPGNSSVTIRGVSTTTGIDQGQGTTGYFINDVPLTDPYNSVAIPDIDSFDVDNISVLRGPQGTLFGSASLGGAVNYQAAQPNLTRYEMHVQGTVENTHEGGTGGSGKIMVNAPLITDVFAVRGVYVYREDGGYIDNIRTGQKNANQTSIRGGRGEALWTPTTDTRVSYLYLKQQENTRDLGYQDPTAGPLSKNAEAEPNNYETEIHNLRLDQNLGFATLTASAAYHAKRQYSVQDVTQALGASVVPGVNPVSVIQLARSHGTTLEVRLASHPGSRLEYLVGAMRDDTHENFVNLAEGPGAAQTIETLYGPLLGEGIGAISAPGDVFLNAEIPLRGQETALFGEASYHFNDAWKLTLGGRAFHTKVTSETLASGLVALLTAGTLTSDVFGSQRESGFLPKGSLTWAPTKDLMTYVLVDKGFRFGGPNLIPPEPGISVPAQFNSDSLINYEMGMRSAFLDQRLQLDGSLFYIDWSDIQLHLISPLGLNYAANAGRARIHGFEISATWQASRGLNLSTNVTGLDARLSSQFDPGGGQAVVPSGSTLPGASKWQVSNLISYNWLAASLTPTLVVSHRFISQAPGTFLTGLAQGDYNLIDARFSLHIKDVSVTTFVENIGDVRGVTTANVTPPTQRYLVRPRTIGVTVDYRL
ncbi:MAG: TonB-dependent receptor [Steroidobacteraceae bacterium]